MIGLFIFLWMCWFFATYAFLWIEVQRGIPDFEVFKVFAVSMLLLFATGLLLAFAGLGTFLFQW